jgi:hypothetical protein
MPGGSHGTTRAHSAFFNRSCCFCGDWDADATGPPWHGLSLFEGSAITRNCQVAVRVASCLRPLAPANLCSFFCGQSIATPATESQAAWRKLARSSSRVILRLLPGRLLKLPDPRTLNAAYFHECDLCSQCQADPTGSPWNGRHLCRRVFNSRALRTLFPALALPLFFWRLALEIVSCLVICSLWGGHSRRTFGDHAKIAEYLGDFIASPWYERLFVEASTEARQ